MQATSPELLARATEAVLALPADVEAARRAARALAEDGELITGLTCAVESDISLTLRVLVAVSSHERPAASVPDAVRGLGPSHVSSLLASVSTFDQLSAELAEPTELGRVRLHSLMVKDAAGRTATALGRADRDELLCGALLHDVGRLALAVLDIHDEHDARLGGAILRGLGLPERLASMVSEHQDVQRTGDAAIIGLADVLARYQAGEPLEPSALEGHAERVGIDGSTLNALLAGGSVSRRLETPCPLSPAQLRVLRGLSRGKAYGQIACELNLSTSTLRTTMHAAKRRLGVADRARAVLVARSNGWI